MVKYFASALFTFLLMPSLTWAEVHKPDLATLKGLTQASIFSSKRFSKLNPLYRESMLALADVESNYEPVILTMAGSIFSRSPDRNSEEWVSLSLAPTARGLAPYYENPIPAYYRQGGKKSEDFYILFPGSYATSKRGSYVNSVVQSLDELYAHDDYRPHILTFAGIFTEEFLSAQPVEIPWNFERKSADLDSRMGQLLFRLNITQTVKWLNAVHNNSPHQTRPSLIRNVGIIGSSGGASLALNLLATDEKAVKRSHRQTHRYNLGAIALSPIVDAQSTFENLDWQLTRQPHKRTLTGGITDATALYRQTGLSVFSDYDSILAQVANTGLPEHQISESAEYLIQAFFNEFLYVDLKTIAEELDLNLDDILSRHIEDQPHYSFFILEACFQSLGNFGLSEEEMLRECRMRGQLDYQMSGVNNLPAFIFSPDDDPVLSTYSGPGEEPGTPTPPDAIREVLENLKMKDNVFVYNPPFGAHVGLLMDEQWPLILDAFFRISEK